MGDGGSTGTPAMLGIGESIDERARVPCLPVCSVCVINAVALLDPDTDIWGG